MLNHIRAIAEASDVPVNADFLAGFAVEPDDVGENVRRCVETGVAGLSIEDSTGDTAAPLFDLPLAVERIRAARAAIDDVGGDVMLVARTECFLTGHPEPLAEAIGRLTAFAEAGADCLYAPGVRSRDDVAALVSAVAPKPLNVLVGWPGDLNVAVLADLGVRRISVGGALARTAWAAFIAAATDIAGSGRFESFASGGAAGDLNAFFETDAARRQS
jgi:2-methylisocitrate lyase-like PEP mutase family enzyme